jgi:glycosyltransferase involved in cell wall biosynthesis
MNMPRDIVIVPSYYRADYLQCCLENILVAEGGYDKEIWVSNDAHPNDAGKYKNEWKELLDVVGKFQNQFSHFKFFSPAVHSYEGNSYNLLEAYKKAYATDAPYVFLIEDDVLITPDFFKWHEAVQQKGNYLASVGWACIRNPKVPKEGSACDYITSSRDYSSIGVCWKRENLHELVQHANPDYYRNPAVYLGQKFPHNVIPFGKWTEQDGLIMRILLQEPDKYTVAWPVLSRSLHFGMVGYHRPHGHRFSGSVQERAEAVRKMTNSVEEMKRLSGDPFGDVIGQPEIGPWNPEELRCVGKFVWDGQA